MTLHAALVEPAFLGVPGLRSNSGKDEDRKN
jgi:hypothetical protein